MQIITNEEIYNTVILSEIKKVKKYLWIATADIKDMHVHKNAKVVSFLSILNDLAKKKVEIRLLHAKEPGENFRTSFDKYPALYENIERQLCPRVHFKQIIIDGKFAYSGSANLTGAGLGIKSANTRNFESGITTTNPDLVDSIMDQFDNVWMGKYCKSCKRKEYCSDPIL